MRILAFVLSHWDSRHPPDRFESTYASLRSWHSRIVELLHPIECFVASGTWSDPAASPLPPEVKVVNAGCPYTGSYDLYRRHYCKGAFTAAMAYALNRTDWDLLVTLDNDALIGDVNFAILNEFLARRETCLSPAWGDWPGGPFIAWKREGAARLLHNRLTANLYDDADSTLLPPKLLFEDELARIYRNGRWWNPWPSPAHRCLTDNRTPHIHPFDDNWPFLRLPRPEWAERYLREKCPLARPL